MRYATLLFLFALITGCQQQDLKQSLEEQFNGPFYGRLVYDNQLIDPRPQDSSERLFEEEATQIVRQFTVHPLQASADSDLVIMVSPVRTVVDAEEQFLFLMDSDSNAVHKFSLQDGALLAVSEDPKDRVTTNGKSTNIHLRANEELWLTGIQRAKVMRTNLDGEFIDFIDLPYSGQVAPTRSGDFVLLETGNLEELFHIYSSEGKKQRSFGILSSVEHEIRGYLQKAHGMGFLGEVRTAGGNSFIYTNFWGAGLLGFTMDGTLKFFRETIDNNPFPPLRYLTEEEEELSLDDSGRGMTPDLENTKSQQFAANVWNGVFYQNTYMLAGDRSFVVDAYDYDTGDYLYSIPSPEGCGIVYVTDKHLYANCLEQGFFQLRRPAPAVNPSSQPELIQAIYR